MTHISLFSGVGGIDLAAEWAGFTTIAQVERDSYCQRVLERHWPGVHRVEDIRDFPDREYGAVTLVSGGPPCQPASTAGKRRGTEDDRWLWPEFARVVDQLLPAWVLAENPLGILSLENGLAIKEWFACLEAQGYTWLPPLVYPIAAFGADHRRYRVFFVAHLDGECLRNESRRSRGQSRQDQAIVTNHSKITTNPDCQRRAVLQGGGATARAPRGATPKPCSWWDTRSRLLRMVHGVRGRMDGHRIRMLGNSCSPQQVYPILKAIAETENPSMYE